MANDLFSPKDRQRLIRLILEEKEAISQGTLLIELNNKLVKLGRLSEKTGLSDLNKLIELSNQGEKGDKSKKDEDYEISQPTLSRDMKELGMLKNSQVLYIFPTHYK